MDEKSIPKKFINPQPAGQKNPIELKAKDLSIQVSFFKKDNRFRISGIDKEESGVIISGRINEDLVKINHFEVAKDLRGIGIGVVLLLKLVDELKKQGVKTVYCKFSHSDIINLLLKNGYEIISPGLLTEDVKKKLLINPIDLDERINSIEDYDNIQSNQPDIHKQILFKKSFMQEKIKSPETTGQKIEKLRKFTEDQNLCGLVLLLNDFRIGADFDIGNKYPEMTAEELADASKEVEKSFKEMNLLFSPKERMVRTKIPPDGKEGYLSYKRYKLSKNKKALDYFCNIKDVDLSDDTIRGKENRDLGKFYGFPDSAIEAFMKGPNAVIQRWKLPKEIAEQDYIAFLKFVLSKENWQEELETVKKWAEAIKTTDPDLYKREVENYKRVLYGGSH